MKKVLIFVFLLIVSNLMAISNDCIKTSEQETLTLTNALETFKKAYEIIEKLSKI